MAHRVDVFYARVINNYKFLCLMALMLHFNFCLDNITTRNIHNNTFISIHENVTNSPRDSYLCTLFPFLYRNFSKDFQPNF